MQCPVKVWDFLVQNTSFVFQFQTTSDRFQSLTKKFDIQNKVKRARETNTFYLNDANLVVTLVVIKYNLKQNHILIKYTTSVIITSFGTAGIKNFLSADCIENNF